MLDISEYSLVADIVGLSDSRWNIEHATSYMAEWLNEKTSGPLLS